MWDGKKSTALKFFYDAIDIMRLKSKMQKTIIRHLDALTNVMPHVEVRSRRVVELHFKCKLDQTEKFLWQ
jgi:small subunit ribosomal protein S7